MLRWIKMLFFMPILCFAQDGHYDFVRLLSSIVKDYSQQQFEHNQTSCGSRFEYDIIDYGNAPRYCDYEFRISGRSIYVPDYGYFVFKPDSLDEYRVVVETFYTRSGDVLVTEKTYRIHYFKINTKGSWYQFQKPLSVPVKVDPESGYYYCF